MVICLVIGKKESGKTTLLMNEILARLKTGEKIIVLDSAVEEGTKSLINKIRNLKPDNSVNIKKINLSFFLERANDFSALKYLHKISYILRRLYHCHVMIVVLYLRLTSIFLKQRSLFLDEIELNELSQKLLIKMEGSFKTIMVAGHDIKEFEIISKIAEVKIL